MKRPIPIRSYVEDRWVEGEGEGSELINPADGEVLATATTAGVDMGAALRHARQVGGRNLRAMTFEERGALLKTLSGVIRDHRDELLEVAVRNGGNTPGDAKFDVDGASGTLAFYAALGRSLGARRHLLDGELAPLGRSTPLSGQHVWVAKPGVAVLINAFNFPAWGLAEKMACATLAAMPVVVKPATQTALLAYEIARLFVARGVLPAGAWSFLAGPAGDLLDHLEGQDVLAFTGSAATGRAMRRHPRVLEKGVRVNVEADSINAAVLGPDVAPGSPTWGLFAQQVVHEMTQKAGQKCTATRRVFVPGARLDEAEAALVARLSAVRVGDPIVDGSGMGPLTSAGQREEVLAGVRRLQAEARVVFRGEAPDGAGCFVPPVLLRADDPHAAAEVHRLEVFGPVATLMPYDGSVEDAAELVARGEGSLVSSVYSDDPEFVSRAVLALAPYNGRLTIGSADVAAEAYSPGMVLPGLVHGGPGRAGGGEELGGLRGVQHYMQRTALQGSSELLAGVLEAPAGVAAETRGASATGC
ncbi:MAG TPA: 3,4-dehydroadipyl-CoA semialdehyde dehydrogenase [Thermoanaerobaculia bacterium]|nr:3,4-dehydroadipyl-CoA semialdehyde dehydrogenase [Thermoanaerobaculia bacterium]